MSGPTVAMVLAAGLGTRMRPLSDDRPKALIEVGGRTLIDHMLDRLAAAGIRRVVVNVHAFADRLEAHLRTRGDLEVAISDERAGLLETGGGLRKARPLLGETPILVANIDSVWIETGVPVLNQLIDAWDGGRMDDLLLTVPVGQTLGFDGPGDFFVGADGRLAHRGSSRAAPLAFMGVHMLDPAIIDTWPAGTHGVFPRWMAFAERGRLYGVVARDCFWMHVGDPGARDEAQARLADAR